MGVYAVAADVESEFRSINFSAADAALSIDEITEFIGQEEAAIEALISGVYSTPITGSKSISVMKLMTVLMVKARVQDILAVKVGSPKPEQGNGSIELRARVMDMIDRLQNRTMQLVDATLANAGGGVQSYASENEVTRAFSRDEEQW